MSKMIMSLLATVAVVAATSAANAHRPVSTPQAKPDFAKTFFDKQQREGR